MQFLLSKELQEEGKRERRERKRDVLVGWQGISPQESLGSVDWTLLLFAATLSTTVPRAVPSRSYRVGHFRWPLKEFHADSVGSAGVADV